MHTSFVVALVIIVSGFVFSWVVGRSHSTAGAVISLIAGLVGRIAAAGAMTHSTLQAMDPGWFIALTALFGLSAIFMSAITAGAIESVSRRRSSMIGIGVVVDAQVADAINAFAGPLRCAKLLDDDCSRLLATAIAACSLTGFQRRQHPLRQRHVAIEERAPHGGKHVGVSEAPDRAPPTDQP